MSRRYYKATRPDGTDFRTGTVRYEVGATVTHPTSKRYGDMVPGDPATYLSVATVPTDCTGLSWPCRLFAVEGIGRPVRSEENLPNKRGFRAVWVVDELPAHEVFGPYGAEVVAILDRAARLTVDEARRLSAARGAAWLTAYGARRLSAAWNAAWSAALSAARGTAAWDAARDAATALVVRDLITPDQFDILYGPWASVMGDMA